MSGQRGPEATPKVLRRLLRASFTHPVLLRSPTLSSPAAERGAGVFALFTSKRKRGQVKRLSENRVS